MDEFIDNLLREESYCDTQLPRLQVRQSYKMTFILFLKLIYIFQKRQALEEADQLEIYVSSLDEDLENLSSEEEPEPEEKPRVS